MPSIRCRKDSGTLLLDFNYLGHRCREQTALADTPANRKRLEKALAQIQAEIAAGKFVYSRHFPNSRLATRFGSDIQATPLAAHAVCSPVSQHSVIPVDTPMFSEFAEEWFAENEVRWRKSYRETVSDILRIHLKPEFGQEMVGQITKADILKFRSSLAKVQTRKSQRDLSASRINYIMMALRQILTEAADRFNYTNPYRNIKPLKVKKAMFTPSRSRRCRRFCPTYEQISVATTPLGFSRACAPEKSMGSSGIPSTSSVG